MNNNKIEKLESQLEEAFEGVDRVLQDGGSYEELYDVYRYAAEKSEEIAQKAIDELKKLLTLKK